MILICASSLITENKDEKTECTRKERLHFSEIIKEVRSAMMSGYEMTYFSNNETLYSITLLKYKSGDKAILTITIMGTEEEINAIQKDPIVKSFSL